MVFLTRYKSVTIVGPMKIPLKHKIRYVEAGVMSSWDDGSGGARDRHDREICIKYGRFNPEERKEKLMEQVNARAEEKRKLLRPISPGEKVHNPWIK